MKTITMNLTATLKKLLRADIIILAIATIILVLGAFILFSISVNSFGTDDNAKLNEFYAPLESRFVADSRAYLNDIGYTNAGVSLTHTTDEDLSRIYTLKIHHRRLDGADDRETEGIIKELTELGFADERCTIRINIIR